MLQKLGKYELVEEVGRGAMGQVYKAIDPLIGRPVALKTITTSLVGDADFLERFYREARSAGALEHPNIVTIYELGQSGDTPFIAMEYLQGESLDKVIERRQPLPLLDKIGFIVPVCRALEYAHKRGVVHRDIKPGNIMLTKDGKIKVVDFGIARLMNASRTQTNMFMGTLSYMSPQLIYGERADERSDIWALGVTLYELLCYQRPFDGDNHASLMLSIARQDHHPRPVTDFIPNCPSSLESILARMLEKDVQRRFQSLEEVLFEIQPLWEGLQQASVSGFVAESEAAIGAQNFSLARDLLRKALQFDTRNTHVRTLLERVNSELRLLQTKAQIASILQRARALMEEGHFKDAQAEAETAVRLDPSAVEICELVEEAKRLAQRKRSIDEGLQLSRQSLVEGELSLALKEIQSVLALDPENAQGHALQAQIREQHTRREEQKRRADFLQRGRKFWAEQKFDDCIELLTDAQKGFPNDSEIAALLEAARLDRAEQQKLKGLVDTRKLLALHQFDAALGKIENLGKLYPGDPAVQQLGALILHEKQEMLHREKRSNEIAVLRSMVNSQEFSEAVARGEKVLKEFSHDSEIAKLVSFARGELTQLEQKKKIEEALQNVSKKVEAKQFKSAISAAEKALARFPGELVLLAALDDARRKLKEKEDHELLQHRINEIRARINKGQHTDAVDLARQTEAMLGSDVQTSQLLRLAEMELAQKREKQENQEKQIAAAQAGVSRGDFSGATQILQNAIETQLLSRRDPRVQELLKKIKDGKTAPTHIAVEPVPVIETLDESAPPVNPSLESGPAAVGAPASFAVPERKSLFSAPGSKMSAVGEPVAILPSPETGSPESLFTVNLEAQEKSSDQVSAPMMTRARLILVAAGALLAIVTIISLSYSVSKRKAREDFALRSRAEQLEARKDWPAALAAFESLAHSNRSLASVGRDGFARLKSRIDQENSIVSAASEAEIDGDLQHARELYQQLADLHGDKEPQALLDVTRLDAVLKPFPLSPGKKLPQLQASVPKTDINALPLVKDGRGSAQASPRSARDTPQAAPRAAKDTTRRAIDTPHSAKSAQACQFITSDVMRHLERADQARGNGDYDHAEILYKDVLACDPNNARATSGLAKTKLAQETERKFSPN